MPDILNDAEKTELSYDDFKEVLLTDYRIACESRQASLLGRREVLTGKAKFGIFGDGKELAQIAMAKVFKDGDWRAGYYRDQTFAFATGISTIYQFFSQLYANPTIEADPASAGRQMNAHFATRILDENGHWKSALDQKNSSADVSTTGGQMPRLLGLALASKVYRQSPQIDTDSLFSNQGNEVAFGTIGNASTSEGVFFEAINAAGVLQVPLAMSIWDDGYGISVPAKYHTTKEDISEALSGLQRDDKSNGYEIFKVRGWDYPGLCETYEKAIKICREHHVPVMIHVTEMTQPQGHSTSGSHERYKSTERLSWEAEHDCIKQMRSWMLSTAVASEEELLSIESDAVTVVRTAQRQAWEDYTNIISLDKDEAIKHLLALEHRATDLIADGLAKSYEPSLKDIYSSVRKAIRMIRNENMDGKSDLLNWYFKTLERNKERFNSKLFTDTTDSPLKIVANPIRYADNAKMVDGREVLNACFDANFNRDPRLLAFGEDVGMIGDVNQGFAGLQLKYGEERIFDTGIRENTIIGQGIGMALRGLRPIAEVQYLDYLLYGITALSDDLASLSYRTKGGQKAPLIIRTRGHRLEGIWHSGSPMSLILGALSGLHICVPRNMTQAAGMYNTLLRSDEPALVIECLNGYRLKERLPDNPGEFIVPLGIAEVVHPGKDVTVVSYGSTLRIVEEAAHELERLGIFIEIIDLQTLAPFDKTKVCSASLSRTNRLLIVDEDIPGGASAYILRHILEEQEGYFNLDAQPRTLTAKAHRPPYGSDGDYFTKPSVDDVIEVIYAMMNETDPQQFPALF